MRPSPPLDLHSPEAAVRAKAAALGAALPAFAMADAPQLFAGWADRVALADCLRHRGAAFDDAVEEANRHIGRPTRAVVSPLAPDGLWLGRIAAALLGEPAAVAT